MKALTEAVYLINTSWRFIRIS